MILYIGDISKQDAEVLRSCAEVSTKVIEFGCGASTQVLAHYTKGLVRSTETVPAWIERTQRNLELLAITNPVEFFAYGEDPPDTYDFIFSDGLPELRLDFALKHWEMLKVGGTLAFHDTRRDHDFFLACQLMHRFHLEVERAEFNVNSSNITLIHKQAPIAYENWNEVEGRKPWQFGHAGVNVEELHAFQLWQEKE